MSFKLPIVFKVTGVDAVHHKSVSDLINQLLGSIADYPDSRVRKDAILALAGFLLVDIAQTDTLSQEQKRNNFQVFSDSFDTVTEDIWKQHFKEPLWVKM
jgi:hypothetical protein